MTTLFQPIKPTDSVSINLYIYKGMVRINIKIIFENESDTFPVLKEQNKSR